MSKASLVRDRDWAYKNLLDVRLVHANNRSIKQLRHKSIIKSSGRAPESVPVRFIKFSAA